RTPPLSRALSAAARTASRLLAASSAPAEGPSTTSRFRSSATDRTNVALPTPGGPAPSTPRRGEAPRGRSRPARASGSARHWASTSARPPTPTRSSRATAAVAGAVGAGEAVAPAGAVADLVVVASEPVPAPVAAGPAPEPVAGPTADRGPAVPAGRTSVVGCTDTTPSGAVAGTVSSVVP